MSDPSTETRPRGSADLTGVWLLLLGGTLVNYFVTEGSAAQPTSAGIVGVAVLVKLGLVAAIFMGLWNQGRGWLAVASGIFVITIGSLAIVW